MDYKCNFPSNLSLACGVDELRPSQSYVAFRKGFAYATNGHILIRQSFGLIADNGHLQDVENLEGQFVHRVVFQTILKHRRIEILTSGIRSVDDFGNVFFYSYPELTESGQLSFAGCKYPATEAVVEGSIASMKKLNAGDLLLGYNSFGINLDKLTVISKILLGYSKGESIIHLGPKHNAIIIQSRDFGIEEQLALVMPIQIGD